jgi:uncharacterized protein YjiS (DUF1127 family)
MTTTTSIVPLTKAGPEPTWVGELRARWPGCRQVSIVRKAIGALVAYRAFRRAEAKLMALDTRMLNDIGLDRSEIGSVLMDRAGERRNGVRPPQSLNFE